MKDSYVSKDDIIRGINILEFVKEFGIKLEETSAGNFDYICRCPSPDHKGGVERTGSCFIDSKANNFWCFGCNIGTNCIDFYMLCTEFTFQEAICELRKRVKPGTRRERYYNVDTNNFYVLLQISKLFRVTMSRHVNDLKWLNDLMRYSDKFILGINSKNDKGARELSEKIRNTIKKRYGE